MKQKLFVSLIGAVLLFALGWLLWSPSADQWLYRTEFQQSWQLINAIEQFRLDQNRLPTELESNEIKKKLGLPADEQCPCYQIEEDGRFIVWFGYQTTGSSMVYDSQSAAWSPRH
ncbi:MAG: hypothetical protein AB8G95_18945 [Anaerolineae bacterium]